jgi:Terpene synthase family 2, C-terminal metal binding
MRIDLPFPSALNPQVHLLDEHLDAVAGRYCESTAADRERWRAVHFEQLAARMYPEAPMARLALSAEALVWLFEYDDYLADLPPESEQSAARRLMRSTAQVLAGELTLRPAQPMGLLWDVCGRARTIAGREWWLRFRHDVQDFADLMYDEGCSRAERRPPSPSSYRRLRRGTSGWGLLTDLAELGSGQPLPGDVVSSGHYHQLRWAAGDLACAVNDLLSYPKELAAQEYHNLVMVLAHSRQVSVAEAKELVTEAIGERLNDYQLARAQFLLWRPSAAGYVRALEHLMRGSLDWSLESGRYTELAGGGRDHG